MKNNVLCARLFFILLSIISVKHQNMNIFWKRYFFSCLLSPNIAKFGRKFFTLIASFQKEKYFFHQCSASKLRLISFNTNSIGKNPKGRQVLLYLKKKNPDLIITIDTRFSKDIENLVKTEWDGNVLFSSFDSQSRGVAIFVKRNLPLKILDQFFFFTILI